MFAATQPGYLNMHPDVLASRKKSEVFSSLDGGTLKNYATILFCLFALSSFTQAKLPIDELGTLIIEPNLSGGSDTWGNFIPAVREQYEQRFGKHPALMLWSDVDDKVMLRYKISFSRSAVEGITPNYHEHKWSDSLHWSDIQDHFRWKLTSVKTGQVKRIPVTQLDNDPLLMDTVAPRHRPSWMITLYFDARTLPVPEDGSAWDLVMEVYEDAPPKGEPILVTSDVLPVVRSRRTTPLDTLEWAAHKNLILHDKDLDHRLLKYFPYNREILSALFMIYHEEKNCDSLRSISQQYWNTLENRLDPFYAESLFEGDDRNGPRPMSNAQREQIQRYMKEVCGDTLEWQPK